MSEQIQEQDIDQQETQEWLDALDAVLRHGGQERASFVMTELAKHAVERRRGPAALRVAEDSDPRLEPGPLLDDPGELVAYASQPHVTEGVGASLLQNELPLRFVLFVFGGR